MQSNIFTTAISKESFYHHLIEFGAPDVKGNEAAFLNLLLSYDLIYPNKNK